MRAATIASVAALAATTLAAPNRNPWANAGRPAGRPGKHWGPPGPAGHHGPPAPPAYGGVDAGNGSEPEAPKQCLTQAEGEEAADVFRQLIQEYSDEVALEYLSEDFVDVSSSVNGIINAGGNTPFPLDQPTFNSRQEFIDGQGAQPEIPFEKLLVLVGCDFVTMRWTTSNSAAGQENAIENPLPSFGNVIITTVPNTEGGEHSYRINKIYSEFSNAAWLVNLGIFVPDPSAIDTNAKRDVTSYRNNMI